MEKRCADCKTNKLLSCFPTRKHTKTGRGSYCYPCIARQTKQHRETHVEAYRAAYRRYAAAHRKDLALKQKQRRLADPDKYAEQRNKARNKRTKRYQEIIKRAKNIPCADCGMHYPSYVMDLDHVRGKKEFPVGIAAGKQVSFNRLVAEIAKCEVVCSNCHRERTHSRTVRNAK